MMSAIVAASLPISNAALGLWAMSLHPWQLETVLLRKAAAYFAKESI